MTRDELVESAHEEIMGIVGDVAADPGGEWLNDGKEHTGECIRAVLDDLAAGWPGRDSAEPVTTQVNVTSWSSSVTGADHG